MIPLPLRSNAPGSVNQYAELDADALWAHELGVTEYATQDLRFLQKIGEGQFGEV